MKTKITTIMAVAVLAAALVFPNIGPADASEIAKFTKTAMKADTNDDLKPKAYGEKTKQKICAEKPCFDQTEEKQSGLKKHQIKEMKKAAEYNKAFEFMKVFYRI